MKGFAIDTQNTIKLEGISGEFNTPHSNFRVRFFSTYANSYQSNYSKLLDELKPMRERVSIDQIKNISQVLQRDLDDLRISHGLIPYLINRVNGVENSNHIPFFPAILGVLIPKGYLTSEQVLPYPALLGTDKSDSAISSTYSSDTGGKFSWKLKQLVETDRISPLSLLEIDIDQAEIIVLDGQHRANAFRVATNRFFEEPDNEVYKPYYDSGSVYPSNIKSDLPVTLIWFEKLNPAAAIVPDLITRRIFIDVNNNAKRISQSRQILLDDRDPSSILTNSFYSSIAESKGFSRSSSLSLIHLGFDMNIELRDRKKNSALNISNPEIINIVLDWFFFATRKYNDLKEYNVGADRTLKFHAAIISELLPDSRPLFLVTKDEEGYQIKTIANSDKKNEVCAEFTSIYQEAFYKLLDEFQLLKLHYKAAAEIQSLRDTDWVDTTKKHIWDVVFVGGEGLYYSISKLIELQPNKAGIKDVKDAIEEIEADFGKIRSRLTGLSEDEVHNVYNSLNTVAFQVAYFMAFYDFAMLLNTNFRERQSLNDAASEFINRINTIAPAKWERFFNVVRENIVDGDIDPKKWPAYHKMIIRLIQQEGEFYSQPGYGQYSPEVKMFEVLFKKKLTSYIYAKYSGEERLSLDREEFKEEHQQEIANWTSTSKSQVEQIFSENFDISAADLMPFSEVDIANSIIEKNVKTLPQ